MFRVMCLYDIVYCTEISHETGKEEKPDNFAVKFHRFCPVGKHVSQSVSHWVPHINLIVHTLNKTLERLPISFIYEIIGRIGI